MQSNDQEGCYVLINQGQGRLSTRLHPFPVADQGSRLFQWCNQAIKAKNKLDQILIPVAGVSTVGIGVTTPCNTLQNRKYLSLCTVSRLLTVINVTYV